MNSDEYLRREEVEKLKSEVIQKFNSIRFFIVYFFDPWYKLLAFF